MKVQNSKFKIQNIINKLTTHYQLLPANKNGFTLIEIIMIIVVISIAIPVILLMIGQGAKQGVNAEIEITASNIGQAMMEEIRSKRWDENSPIPPGTYSSLGKDGAECRTACTGLQCGANPIYNDIDDYNGYSETCSFGGTTYATTVAVCYVAAGALDTCIGGPTDYKRIQVTVTNAVFGSVQLVTVVTNY